MAFQSGQTKAPWPTQGKLNIDNGAPQHTYLQVISGQVTFAGASATILNPNITATSQFLFTPAPGITGATPIVGITSITPGTGVNITRADAVTTGTFNYVIIG